MQCSYVQVGGGGVEVMQLELNLIASTQLMQRMIHGPIEPNDAIVLNYKYKSQGFPEAENGLVRGAQ